MAKEQSHSASTNATQGSCVECSVSINRRVQYVFKTGLWNEPLSSEKKLRIPVVIAVDGKAKPEFAKGTKDINAYKPLDVWVQPGQKVGLFLNSDAVPGRQKAEVFQITPNERNVVVIVNERRKVFGELDKPKFVATKRDQHGLEYDEYEATLTGDVWKKVTHKFSAEEAKTLIPASVQSSVKDAVLSIYDGRCKGSLDVLTAKGVVRVHFEDALNPKESITGFNMYSDGLPRVHPNAWLAVIEAAMEANIREVKTSSAWRPLLGSIAHRTGLALDVTYVDGAHINRQGLTPVDVAKHKHSPYVSSKEKELFAKKEEADAGVVRTAKQVKDLEQRLSKVPAGDPRREDFVRELRAARLANQEAKDVQRDAVKAWSDEKDAHEPERVKSFRKYLLRCECVRQVFDPWFMDANAHDNQEPAPNMQKSANEALHANHLHITVKTPGLSV